jgi:hypothetical protein
MPTIHKTTTPTYAGTSTITATTPAGATVRPEAKTGPVPEPPPIEETLENE